MKGLIIAIIVGALMFYLNTTSKKVPESQENGTIILRMNGAYKVIGYLGNIFSLLFIYIAFNSNEQENFYGFLGLALFFIVLSSLIILASKVFIEISDEKIIYHGMTGKIKIIQWNKIKEVTFNNVSLELSVKTNEKK